MNTYIVLLRGINVGGKNKIPMKELKVLLEQNGFENVKTYIQSGNVVFESISKPKTDIGKIIEKNLALIPSFYYFPRKSFYLQQRITPIKTMKENLYTFIFVKRHLS